MALYESLTAQSTPDQIAAAYKEAIAGAGGDTAANQQIATNYLTNLGISAPTIQSAYQTYLGTPAAAPATAPAAAPATAPATTFTAPAYFNQNPDVAAAYAQNSYGMTPEEFAKNHYEKYGWLERRAAPTNVTTPTDAIENLYNTYAQRWSDPEGYAYWSKQFGPTVDANEAAIFRTAVEEARRAGTESPTIYSSLTGQSTPDQIAAAYNQYVKSAGGDTQKAQENAANYLSKLGLSTDTIRSAYDQYKSDYASGVADKLISAFGGTNPQLSGILSGFEALGRGDFTEDQAKRILGTDTFNQYKSAFSDEANKYLGGILADSKLSGQEALDFMQNARKYGIDTPEEFASLTGKSKDLYSALSSGYDTTAKTLINSALGTATTDADRLKTGLALQDKFGFTYDDLAKATGYDTKQIKDWFEPVRNFGDEFKKITSAPDASGKDILSFLDTAKKNGSVDAVYGSNIDAMQQKLNALNDKWSGYGVDGYQAENVYNQLNAITNAAGGKNWGGSWAGGGDNAAKEATKRLVQKGVDNLSDLKVQKNYERTGVAGESYNGQFVRTDENGRKYVFGISERDPESVEIKYLPADAKTVPTKYVGDDESGRYEPLTAEELKTYDPKTGKFDLAVGNKLVDASSGKVVAKGDGNNFVLDHYESGNFFKSKDHTLGLMMTDSGVPVPYQTTQKGGFLYSPVFPIMASFLLPGAGAALSSGIASATGGALAAGSLANTALAQGIMSGALSKAADGSFEKGFISGALNPVVSSGISSLLPAGIDPALAKTATNVGTSVATSALTGRPIDWTSTALNAGVQYGAQQLPWNLTPQQLNLLGGIATPLLQGQSIDPVRLGGILANYAIKSQTPYNAGAR